MFAKPSVLVGAAYVSNASSLITPWIKKRLLDNAEAIDGCDSQHNRVSWW
jgi:hypothetical protein